MANNVVGVDSQAPLRHAHGKTYPPQKTTSVTTLPPDLKDDPPHHNLPSVEPRHAARWTRRYAEREKEEMGKNKKYKTKQKKQSYAFSEPCSSL